jgi:hypothetical protein
MNVKRIFQGLGVLLLIGVFIFANVPATNAVAQGEYKIYLPMVLDNYLPTPQPLIHITYMPPCREYGYISGTVQNVDPTSHKILVYIYVSGWWNKPTFANPLTDINADGTWNTYVTTGGNDTMATKFAAFVVPAGYVPPLLSGPSALPAELYTFPYDIQTRDCPLRQITFSGYTWYVKASVGPTGPGSNFFTDNTNDVFVDSQGYLHLNIVYRDNRWWCSEVINSLNLGYGTYVFKVASPLVGLDPSVVLGLFTWDDTSALYAHREIDIEFSTWNIAGNQNSQYVVQPYDISGNIYRFDTTYVGITTQGFIWQPTSIFFQSLEGDAVFPSSTNIINSWSYTGGSIPIPGNENTRINLWLNNATAPAGPLEIIIQSFQFIPG